MYSFIFWLFHHTQKHNFLVFLNARQQKKKRIHKQLPLFEFNGIFNENIHDDALNKTYKLQNWEFRWCGCFCFLLLLAFNKQSANPVLQVKEWWQTYNGPIDCQDEKKRKKKTHRMLFTISVCSRFKCNRETVHKVNEMQWFSSIKNVNAHSRLFGGCPFSLRCVSLSFYLFPFIYWTTNVASKWLCDVRLMSFKTFHCFHRLQSHWILFYTFCLFIMHLYKLHSTEIIATSLSCQTIWSTFSLSFFFSWYNSVLVSCFQALFHHFTFATLIILFNACGIAFNSSLCYLYIYTWMHVCNWC